MITFHLVTLGFAYGNSAEIFNSTDMTLDEIRSHYNDNIFDGRRIHLG
jgi:precorrin-4 methylase